LLIMRGLVARSTRQDLPLLALLDCAASADSTMRACGAMKNMVPILRQAYVDSSPFSR
jgi:hypothetical protein